MESIALRIAFCFIAWSVWTVGAQDNSFYRKYNLGGMHGGLHLEKTSEGGFIATGQHQDNGSAGGCDIYVYSVDKCGNTLWFKLYGGGGTDGGKTIRETADGGYIVSGHYASGLGFLMRLDIDGNVMWLRTYSPMDWTFYADQTSDGGFIAAGRYAGASVFFKTDGAGNVQWARRITGVGEFPMFIQESQDGNYYFTSSFNVPARDIAAGALSPAGTLLWCKGYGAGWTDVDHSSWSCRGLIDETDQTLVITSPIVTQGSGGEDILLMKVTKASGDIVWSKAIGAAGSDQSRDIELTDIGYAVIGNTNSSPFAASQFPDQLTENMSERDVLLVYVDKNGDELWSRTYGATGRDKGIGVKFNDDRSFTVSAYTSSPFFGVSGGSFDPLFIKTDTLGIVNCQTGFPILNFTNITIPTAPIGSPASFTLSAAPVSPIVSNYNPNDVYQCQACYTEPDFTASDTLVCTGQPVYFYNTTSVGLTCFQEWLIGGEIFPGYIDTLTYVFSSPGVFTVQLYSSCGGFDQTFELNVHVYEVSAGPVVLSDYSGFGVSCYGSTNGSAQTSATGGYFTGSPLYSIEWAGTNASTFAATNLSAGDYQITISDDLGCSVLIPIEITEPPPLQVELSITSNYNGFPISCHGASDGSVLAAPDGGVAPYSITWSANGVINGLTVSGLSAGTIAIDLSDQNGCPASTSISLSEPDPVQTAAQVTSDFNGYAVSCNGASDGTAAWVATVGGTNGSYTNQWYSVPPACSALTCMTSLAPGQTSALNASPAGSYALVATDLNGCTGMAQLEITEPSPVSGIIMPASDFNGYPISCFGASDGALTSSGSGGVPGYSYLWLHGPNAHSVNNLSAGSYSVTITDNNGCSHTIDTLLDEPDPLSVSVVVVSDYNGAQISCTNASDGMLQATADGGVQPYQYNWSSGQTGSISNGLSQGVYSAVATDANGCTATEGQPLVHPTPVAPDITLLTDYNGYHVSCYGAVDGMAQGVANGGTGAIQLLWQGNTSGSTNAPQVTMGAGTLSLTGTDVNGCAVTVTTPVTQPDPVVADVLYLTNFNGFEVSCFGATDGAYNVIPSGGVNPYFITPGNVALFGNLPAGTYLVEVEDANGCSTSVEAILQQPDSLFALPVVVSNYNGAQISCFGASDGQAQASGQGGVAPYSYEWSNGAVGNLSQATFPAGPVSVTVMDANACLAVATIHLEEPDPIELAVLPGPGYNGYDVSCHGATDGVLHLSASGGTGAILFSMNGIGAALMNQGLGAGNYQVVAIDLNGCTTQQQVLLIQPPALQCQTVVLSNYNGFGVSCPNATDGSAEVSITGGVAPYTHIWSNTASSEVAQQLAAGLYVVSSTDANGCGISCQTMVTQPTAVQIDFLALPDTCGQSRGEIHAFQSGGVNPYVSHWSLNGEWLSSGFSISELELGEYLYSVSDMNGCTYSRVISLDNIPEVDPELFIAPSPACAEKEVNFTVVADKPIRQWEWDFGDGNTSFSEKPVHSYVSPGNYPIGLVVWDEHGCKVERSANLIVIPGMHLYIPNSFTPDNDGINDVFGAYGEGVETFNIQIFDRWGILVFESNEMDFRWNGSFRNGGHYVQPDVYVYKVEVSSVCAEPEQFSGSVVLIR